MLSTVAAMNRKTTPLNLKVIYANPSKAVISENIKI